MKKQQIGGWLVLVAMVLLFSGCGGGGGSGGEVQPPTPNPGQMGGSIQLSPIALTGVVSTLAGPPPQPQLFDAPVGAGTDGTSLFVAEEESDTTRGVVPAAGDVTGHSGATSGHGASDGAASLARFNNPQGITTDGVHLFVADAENHTIRKIVIASGVVTTLAGFPGTEGSADGTGTAARLRYPWGITTDGGHLFVTSWCTIRKISLATGQVTTLAGSPGAWWPVVDGVGTAARFNGDGRITTDGKSLFMTETGSHTIRRIRIGTGEVTTLAGLAGASGTADGSGQAARFNRPMGITTDGTHVFVGDTYNFTIRKIAIATGEVTTLAGSPGQIGRVDGRGAAARFGSVHGLTSDGTNLFVADTNQSLIRKVVIATGDVTTLAGTGEQGWADGAGSAAAFVFPTGLTTDGKNLFVTDLNHSVRSIR